MAIKRFSIALTFAAATPAVRDIPGLGLGTWLSDRDSVASATDFALTKAGYDHIDAAWVYRNEDQTGKGIAASGLSRSDIWVTSKLWNTHHRPEQANKYIRESIANLGVDYLDLYLIHWPVAQLQDDNGGSKLDPETTIVDTWRTMEELVRANLTRYIGVSNFAKKDVAQILEVCEICPYAHEYETHPYLQQQEFLEYHDSVGVKVIAYSPLGNTNPIYRKHDELGPLLKDPFWTGIAETKNVTVAQAVLAWGLQRGTSVIPKSASPKHIEENRGALDIKFTEEEMESITKQDKKARMSDPSKSWGVQLFADLDAPGRLDGEVDEL